MKWGKQFYGALLTVVSLDSTLAIPVSVEAGSFTKDVVNKV